MTLRDLGQLVVLLLFAAFQAAGFVHSVGLDGGLIRQATGLYYGSVTWKMFTYKAPNDADRAFQTWSGDEWVNFPLQDHYPAQWDGGYRWNREVLDHSPAHRLPFLREVCRLSQAEKARLVFRTWPVTPGTFVPFKRAKKNLREIAVLTCPVTK